MIDLHLHLDGSLRPETVRELLVDEGIDLSLEEVNAMLTVSKDCKDLNDYLRTFEYPVKVLQKACNIERVVKELGMDLHAEGLTYAEVRFAPLLSTEAGLTIDEVVEAAIRGAVAAMDECRGFRMGLILCCMRGNNHEANMDTVRAAGKYLGDVVCALDLAGAEALYDTELFEEEFRLARELGVPFTIHAGEAAGPESIWKALEMGARRIGHGIRCIEDDALVEYLIRHEIPLEICPTSNMQTRVFGDMDEYPLKELFLMGVHTTLNTDNRTVSDTNLKAEREFAKKYCRMTDEELDAMEEYSYKARFLQD